MDVNHARAALLWVSYRWFPEGVCHSINNQRDTLSQRNSCLCLVSAHESNAHFLICLSFHLPPAILLPPFSFALLQTTLSFLSISCFHSPAPSALSCPSANVLCISGSAMKFSFSSVSASCSAAERWSGADAACCGCICIQFVWRWSISCIFLQWIAVLHCL